MSGGNDDSMAVKRSVLKIKAEKSGGMDGGREGDLRESEK